MNKIYKSKIDKWLQVTMIATILLLAGVIVTLIVSKCPWAIIAIESVIIAFVVWLFLDILNHTNYSIVDDKLIVKCGCIYQATIRISKVYSISKSGAPKWMSSPALSSERLLLTLNQKSQIAISPEDSDEFISDLCAINPAIVVAD